MKLMEKLSWMKLMEEIELDEAHGGN